MILRFAVLNHGCLRDEQVLSLIGSSRHRTESFSVNVPQSKHAALTVASIYGANGSGKSTLLNALAFMRDAVINSYSASPESPIPRRSFALGASRDEQPSRYVLDFVTDATRYQYGFEALNARFAEEWLYSFSSGRRQVLFYRSTNGEQAQFQFSSSLKGPNKTIERLTRPNSLFLSAAARNNHEQLGAIFRFFLSQILVFDEERNPPPIEVIDDPARRVHLLELLAAADIGVIDARTVEVNEGTKELYRKFIEALREVMPGSPLSGQPPFDKEVKLGHKAAGGGVQYFPAFWESGGTRKLLALLGPVLQTLESGGVILVDELDRSLHTLLSVRVLGLFTSSAMNRLGAQLIFSTHDTNLLCSKALHRDAIWFTEKSPDGSAVLYPLSDIRLEPNDNIEKGYLQGRFGAVPFLGRFDDILGTESVDGAH